MNKWETIKGFEDYSININGLVKNNKTDRILKPMISTSGYVFFHLVKDKKKYTKYLHRLIGEIFIPNPDNLPQIDHIDGNKLNNDISNLHWVSISENRTAYGNLQRAKNRMREVIAVNENGEKITFDSRKSAAIHFECCPAKIKYGYKYTKGKKSGWIFYKVEDIV
jgi:hypothetical protein